MSKSALNLECSAPFHLDPTAGPSDVEVLEQLREETADDDLAEALEEPEDESTSGMRYGNGFHELLAQELTSYDPQNALLSLPDFIPEATRIAEKYFLDPAELIDRVAQSKLTLISWLSGENPYGIDFRPRERNVELPLALGMIEKTVRVCAPTDSDTHVYPDIDYKTEYPGTADLLIEPLPGAPKLGRILKSRGLGLSHADRAAKRSIMKYANIILVLDHKTGQHVPPPHEMPQLWALALAGVRLFKAKGAILATLHAPRGGAPTVYCSPDVVEAEKLERFYSNLVKAWSRIGDGSLRPGPHCVELFCPRFDECEIHRPALLQLGLGPQRTEYVGESFGPRGGVDPTLSSTSMRPYAAPKPDAETFALDLANATPETISRVAAGLTEFGRLAKALRGPLRERIKELNASGEVVASYERPGKRLDVIEVKKRSVSIKSITEACGPKEVSRLEKLGAIRDISYERVQTKNDS